MDTGQTVQMRVPIPGGKNASIMLMMRVEVQPHPTFRQQGNDIHVTQEMPFVEALLGRWVAAADTALAANMA